MGIESSLTQNYGIDARHRTIGSNLRNHVIALDWIGTNVLFDA